MSQLNFEYFDPQVELCTFDDQGRPVRPRKKPGRKPNPPSPAQRKAQNRAAQQAFRERKRREMKDNETNIKKCLQQRDQAIHKAKSLQRIVKQLRYENNYLKGKGCLLTLKLACFSHNINVPKFWNTGATDAVGADILSLSKTEGIPQCLEFFLDNKMHIINKSPEIIPTPTNDTSLETTNLQPQPTSIPDHLSNPYSSTSIGQQYTQKMDSSFYSAMMTMTMMSDIMNQPSSFDDIMNVTPCPTMTHTFSSSSPSPSSSSSPKTLYPFKQIYPPMPAADAINYLQQKNKGRSYSRFIFKPTELQQSVTHDPRIDSVPGPLIRDHMILFQDYYDANVLFSFLINQCYFMGGQIGNADHWYVPPSFFKTYWFLMPNHRPRRLDNAIEMALTQGRTLSRMMFQRKKMYLDREKYADYFPPLHRQSIDNPEDEETIDNNDTVFGMDPSLVDS